MSEDNIKDITDNASTRFLYTNDIIAGISITLLNVVVGYAIITGISLNVSIITAYVLVNLAAGGWLFGKDLAQKYKQK